MTGHATPPRGKVSLLGVIAGGLLIGAGGFGLYRVTNANPADGVGLPPLPPVSEPRADAGALPPILPAAGSVPIVLPPLGTPMKPGEVPPPPAPLPPPPTNLPMPSLPALPDAGSSVAKPLALPSIGELPAIGDLPKPGGPDATPPALPPVPGGTSLPSLPSAPGGTGLPALPPMIGEASTLPKPAMPELPTMPKPTTPDLLTKPALPEVGPSAKPVLPELPSGPKPVSAELPPAPKPVVPLKETAPIPPAAPDFNLRPAPSGNTVNPGQALPAPPPAVLVLPAPAGQPDLPTPGEVTMPLNLRQSLLSAALGVGLGLSSNSAVRAQDPPAQKPVAVDPDLKKQIEDLKKEITTLRRQSELHADYILGRTDGKEPVLPVEIGLLKRMQTLEEAIKRIEAKLDAGTKQAAGSSPIRESAVVLGNGTIRLINEYPTDVKIVVNGTSYELKQSEVREVIVSAGEFVYELMAVGASKMTSTIKDGERVTLRIK